MTPKVATRHLRISHNKAKESSRNGSSIKLYPLNQCTL